MPTAPAVVVNLPGYPFSNLPSVTSFDALRAMASTSLINGQDIAVDAAATAGDGLGGLFSWASASLAADNNSSVIKPTDKTDLQAGRWLASGDTGLRGSLAGLGGSGAVGFQQAGAGAVARTVQDELRQTVSIKQFGGMGNDSADETAAFNAAFAELAGNQYEGARALYLPGGIYRISSTLVVTLANSSITIWSDAKATIRVDNLADDAWAIDVDYATGGTANFVTFNMTNVAIAAVAVGRQRKVNGIRMKRVIGSKFTQCEFNYLKSAVDMGDDSNLNTFDTCMWRANVTGWNSTAGVANNNVFLTCQWRYHTGTAFNSTGTGGNKIIGGDFEPDNASPVVIAEQLTMRRVRFERNTVNGLTGIRVLNDNELDVDSYCDGASQVLPLFEVVGNDNTVRATGNGAQAVLVKAGAKRNVSDIGKFAMLQSPSGSVYSCEDAEPSNVLRVRSSAQGNGKTIVETVKSELVPSDLTLWTATNCTVALQSDGGYLVSITGAGASLTYTPSAGAYSKIFIASTAVQSAAASQPIMSISGGPATSFNLGNGNPSFMARRVNATFNQTVDGAFTGAVYTNPTFTIVPAASTNGTNFTIYNLRSAQGACPE